MGGRGAASGMSDSGKPYGTEFKTLLKESNIKFVRSATSSNAKDPLETQTRGRVYATVNDDGKINSINYYDSEGKRRKSINLLHDHKEIKGEHAHVGYYHKEGGTRNLTDKERELVAFVRKVWYKKRSK